VSRWNRLSPEDVIALAEAASVTANAAQADATSALALIAALDSSDVSNDSGAAGATVTDALDGIDTRVTAAETELALKANIASPALTGTPTAPISTNAAAGVFGGTQIATTGFALRAFCCDAIDLWDDHIATTTAGSHGWIALTSGTGASATKLVVAGRSGTTALSTGTTATGRAALGHETSTIAPCFYRASMTAHMVEAIVSVETLSTIGVEQFTACVGMFRQGNVSADFSDGLAICYDLSTSPRWYLQSRTAGVVVQTVTTADAAATVTTGYAYLRLEWDETAGASAYAGTSAATAVLIGTIAAANVTYTQPVGLCNAIRKSVGSLARRLIIDQGRVRAVMKGR